MQHLGQILISLFVIAFLALSSLAVGRAPSTSLQPGETADPHITPEERAAVVKLLVDTRKQFLDSIQDLTDEQWNFRPGPFKWTIGQISEHIVLAEAKMFSLVTRAVETPPNPDWETKTAGKTALLNRVMPSTAYGKAKAPYEIQPMGKLSKAEVIQRYNEVRDQTLQFAEQTQIPLKEHTFDHPFPAFSTLNAYQWLINIGLHNERHDAQIAAVKDAPGYPKN
ncbi:MAG TPA: DinB family protein [Blastocatellia bacterium]